MVRRKGGDTGEENRALRAEKALQKETQEGEVLTKRRGRLVSDTGLEKAGADRFGHQ